MTVETTKAYIQYKGDGSTTTYVYNFYVPEYADLEVYLDDQPSTIPYTIDGIGDPQGGTVTFDSPPADGVLITLIRYCEIVQKTDYTDISKFSLETIEKDFDKRTMVEQQLEAMLRRTIHVPIFVDPDFSWALPSPIANRCIKVNDTETGLVMSDYDPDEQYPLAKAEADRARVSADEAAVSAQSADEDALLASEAAVNAAASEDKAALWAQAPEDQEVEPGLFSAFHWAMKAEDYAQVINPDNLFTKTDHISVSTGAADANKPIVLNSEGKVDDSMVDIPTGLNFIGPWTPTAGNEYPTGYPVGSFWLIEGVDPDVGYTFTGGDLSGKTCFNGDTIIIGEDGWSLKSSTPIDPDTFYKLDGSTAITGPFAGGGQQFKNAAPASDPSDLVRFDQVVPVTGGSFNGDVSIRGQFLIEGNTNVRGVYSALINMLSQQDSAGVQIAYEQGNKRFGFWYQDGTLAWYKMLLFHFENKYIETNWPIRRAYDPTNDDEYTRKLYVDNADAALQTQINSKANITYVDSADSDLQNQINDRATVSYVDAADSALSTRIDVKVDSDPSIVSGSERINNMIALTQSEYDAITNPDPNVLYIIKDETRF